MVVVVLVLVVALALETPEKPMQPLDARDAAGVFERERERGHGHDHDHDHDDETRKEKWDGGGLLLYKRGTSVGGNLSYAVDGRLVTGRTKAAVIA